MSNSFTFPPPPPPPPRSEARPDFAINQASYQYPPTGAGRGYGFGQGTNRGGSQRPYTRGGASYRGDNTSGQHRGGGDRNAGDHRGGYASRIPNQYGKGYGQTNGNGAPGTHSYAASNVTTRGSPAHYHSLQQGGQNDNAYQSSYRPTSRDGQIQNAFSSSPPFGGAQSSRKRPFSAAFNKTTGPRPQAAPAVPSFNAGIPTGVPMKPAEVTGALAKTKKPRKHNQLGLTPASQDHESSSDDENEEAKLASVTTNSASLVQFEYKGRTATLKSAAEIAAWIAERKKRYPTVAKAETAKKEAAEKKRKWADEKKKRDEAAKEKRLEREKNQQEAWELRRKTLENQKEKQKAEAERETQLTNSNGKEKERGYDDPLKKAQIKAEKLRRKAAKAEIRAIKAEAAAKIASVRRASLQSNSTQDRSEMKDGDSAIVLEDHDEGRAQESTLAVESDSASSTSSLSISDSSDMSDADETSSAGSSGSDPDSDSASGPEQTTTKRLAPDRVPPPPRRPNLCRRLMNTGKCRYGAACQYSHDIPETARQGRAEKRKPEAMSTKKERRKGLWQVMVDKELEEERKHVLKAIIFMGEKGMLDGQKPTTANGKGNGNI